MKLGLDFRTKLLMTVSLSYVMITGNLGNEVPILAMFCYILPAFLILSEGKIKIAAKWTVIIIISLLLQKYMMGKGGGFWVVMTMFLSYFVLKMGAGLMLGGYSIYSTGISDMVMSLKRGRVPDQVIIPIIVMARFFYTVRQDYRQVKEAMFLNGLTGRRLIFKPAKLLEYRMVPLLMCLSKTADDVAVSAMTRGLQPGKERSSISSARLRFRDIPFLMFSVFLLAVHIYFKFLKR